MLGVFRWREFVWGALLYFVAGPMMCSRFFLNLPDEELKSFERLFVQLEQAWWHYDDMYRPEFEYLPKFELQSFCRQMFQRCPSLSLFASQFDTQFAKFRDYIGKVREFVPVRVCVRCVNVCGMRVCL